MGLCTVMCTVNIDLVEWLFQIMVTIDLQDNILQAVIPVSSVVTKSVLLLGPAPTRV